MTMGRKSEDPAVRPDRRGPIGTLILAPLLLGLAGACILVSWRLRGAEGLYGSITGIAIGTGIALMAGLLRRKVGAASGPKMVKALMMSVCASFGLFLVAALAVGLLWRSALAPVLLSALAIHLTVLFSEASRW
jgi:hypothetical protein